MLTSFAALHAEDLTLWYDKPALDCILEGLPIGNGPMGALIYGDADIERVQFNADTLWTGDQNTTGFFQDFGEVSVDLSQGQTGEVTGYRRELNIDRAVYQTRYVRNGVHFTREMFASHPARVIVLRFTADKSGAYSGVIHLKDAHKAVAQASPGSIKIAGALPEGEQYEAQLRVIPEGGSSSVREEGIEFSKADALTLILSAETDYVPDETRQWRGDPPGPKTVALLDAAAKKGYSALLAEHVADYQQLFHRCHFTLPESSPEQLAEPTDERLRVRGRPPMAPKGQADRYATGKSQDSGLDALFFQFGRYLMISCSRPGDLPSNLQGVWNNSNRPRWRSDYHSNINLQMNYWPAEVTNLAELHTPLFDYLKSQMPAAREHTREKYGEKVRGWTVGTENGVYGGTTYIWNPPGSAWYALHYWEHYAFGGDKTFLRETAYPVLKEVCEFWEDVLIRRPDGTLAPPPSWSPEHGKEDEVTAYDLEWVYDVFTNYMKAADLLGLDKPFRDKVAAMRGKLMRPKIGKWGQLQEWESDRDDPKDNHKHISHLVGIFPSNQITAATPELFEAARVSLKARGDGGPPWSKAWKSCAWARYRNANHAYYLFRSVLNYANQVGPYKNRANGTTPNLLALHPPFQIDANFGATAAVVEMLLQSHEGFIDLLPALPEAWPEGSITGLRARGGYEVDLAWKEGKLTAATIRSVHATGGQARYAGKTIHLNLKPGGEIRLGLEAFKNG